MNLKPSALLSGFKPLYWISGRLVLARGYSLYWSDASLRKPQMFSKLPVPLWWKMLVSNRGVERVFRGGVQTAELLDENHLLVVTRSYIWLVDLITGAASLDFEIPEKRRLLFLTRLPNREGGHSLVFGEYFNNPGKRSVRIWSRATSTESKWSVVHVFDPGEINHVHNVCASVNGDVVYVLTGDFGDGAAIWKADADFRSLVPIAKGQQVFRGTWLKCTADGDILFATDTQLQQNYLCLLKRGEQSTLTKLSTLNGSSIYFQFGENVIYFSTAVEPDEPSGNVVFDLFSRKRGPGITDDFAVIYQSTFDGAVSEVYRAKKDFYPLRLGQFGTFMFPGGDCPSSCFVAYGVGLEGCDNKTLLFDVA